MGRLSDDLRDMGFVTTGEESPVDENGTVWRKGIEAVCDETGVVIDGGHVPNDDRIDTNRERHRYRNSGRVKMNGAFLQNFDWGNNSENKFRY